jgi:hypothetical protein
MTILSHFSQTMIEIGKKHGNIQVDTLLYGRKTIREKTLQMVDDIRASIVANIAEAAKSRPLRRHGKGRRRRVAPYRSAAGRRSHFIGGGGVGLMVGGGGVRRRQLMIVKF